MTIGRSISEPTVIPRLGFWDAVSIIVGIVVGTAIFRAPSQVFDNAGGPWAAIALWLAGGVLAWCGAVCYAELATTYPRDGGDYEYLNRAYGSWAGFLFSWVQLTAVISGNIAIMAYAFADYGARLLPGISSNSVWLTISPIILFSVLNAFGIVAGKVTQNVLAGAKVVGLAAIIVAAFLTPATNNEASAVESTVAPVANHDFGLALVFVLYAYGGWVHAAYVAAEVRDQHRNLPRALIFAIVGIAIIYVLVNGAYFHVLGYDVARHSATPAADVLQHVAGGWGDRAISALVMLSALGAINGMILTAARIYAVWGSDYQALAWLGAWNRRSAAPVAAIVVQAAFAVLLVLLVGTEAGRTAFDRTLKSIGLAAVPWRQYGGGFDTLVIGSAPAYWALTLLTCAALFVLRVRNPTLNRPFAVPLFPVPAIVFCAACAYMLYSSVAFANWLSLISIAPTALGGLTWLFLRRSNRSQPRTDHLLEHF